MLIVLSVMRTYIALLHSKTMLGKAGKIALSSTWNGTTLTTLWTLVSWNSCDVDWEWVKAEWLDEVLCGVRGNFLDGVKKSTLVSGSTSSGFSVVSSAETSGTYWSLRSRSSSWSLNEIPRTGPFWILFIKWVVKPAILLRSLFEGMTATLSAILLLVWKSSVSLG